MKLCFSSISGAYITSIYLLITNYGQSPSIYGHYFQRMVSKILSQGEKTSTEDEVQEIQESPLSIKCQASFLPTFYFL